MTAPTSRPMRADARRNYERLVAAARQSFEEHGPEAPLDDIARRAGVGAGTLYRHFPTRTDLVAAVYQDDIAELCRQAYDLLEQLPPSAALAAWMKNQIGYVGRKRGMGATLKAALGPDPELLTWCRERLYAAAGALLDAGQRAGTVRPDISPAELLKLGHGIGVACEAVPAEADKLLAVMLDGLAHRPQ